MSMNTGLRYSLLTIEIQFDKNLVGKVRRDPSCKRHMRINTHRGWGLR
jgi:hypothetical protein